MRIWKIISGVLSIAAGLLTAYQSYFVSPPDNALLPAAGLAAAALLFIAGIIAFARQHLFYWGFCCLSPFGACCAPFSPW